MPPEESASPIAQTEQTFPAPARSDERVAAYLWKMADLGRRFLGESMFYFCSPTTGVVVPLLQITNITPLWDASRTIRHPGTEVTGVKASEILADSGPVLQIILSGNCVFGLTSADVIPFIDKLANLPSHTKGLRCYELGDHFPGLVSDGANQPL